MSEQKNNTNQQHQPNQKIYEQPKQSSLVQTFVPKQIIRKNKSNFNTASILQKNSFQKEKGNIYLQISPPQIKFAGYQLNKLHTAIVKVINKAPIPQRIHVLPPTQTNGIFSIKMNKKGSIPSGMSQNITVQFKSDIHKYQYDVLKINSETQNFIVPLYAYPTIPNINKIFPKIIDFGTVTVNQTASNIYPIQNPVPQQYQYQFFYQKECQQIMIAPLKGFIPSQQTLNIQISFTPKSKKTYTSEVTLCIRQFDLEPIKIKIMGTGKDPNNKPTLTGTNFGKSTSRIKSSKLAPLKKQDKSLIANQNQRNLNQDQAVQSSLLNETSQQVSKQKINNRPLSNKKALIRSSFPKLLATKKPNNTLLNDGSLLNTKNVMSSTNLNVRKIEQKQYLSRYNRIQDLDKEKDIKFSQFLGDKALTQQEIDYQNKIKEQFKNGKLEILRQSSIQRYNPQISENVQVQYPKLPQNKLTFDDNKNDQLKRRQLHLDRFMKAGTKVILKYRMLKRLDKIRQFLSDCNGDKKKVAKKVQNNYLKSLQVGFDNSKKSLFSFQFSFLSLEPQSFPIFYKESDNAKNQNLKFQTAGKPEFDDLTTLSQVERHEAQAFAYSNLSVASEFVNFAKEIPKQRYSAQQQYALRGPSLPQYSLIQSTSVYSLPLKIPSHYFIYDDLKIRRFKNYNEVDEKDIEYLYEQNLQINPIEDQFQGWSKGQYQILKAKLMRNSGVQFTQGFQGYCGSGYSNDIGFLGKLDKHLPFELEEHRVQKSNQYEDYLDEGDSDQQRDPTLAPKIGQQIMNQVQIKDNKIKERRQKQGMVNQQKNMLIRVESNMKKIKDELRSGYVDKLVDLNKWAVQKQNRIYL